MIKHVGKFNVIQNIRCNSTSPELAKHKQQLNKKQQCQLIIQF